MDSQIPTDHSGMLPAAAVTSLHKISLRYKKMFGNCLNDSTLAALVQE